MEFKLPDLGEGVHEGQIIKLLVKEGEQVVEDQPLMEVETDKAAVEIPSPFTGSVQKWHVAEQQVVNVGDVMVTFSKDGATATATGASQPAAAKVQATTTTTNAGATAIAAPAGRSGRRVPASPAVRKLAKQLGVDIETVPGSGPSGRVTRGDVESAAAGSLTASSPTVAPAATVAATSAPAPPPPPAPVAAAEPEGAPDTDRYGPIIRQPVTQARKTIAAIMTTSWRTIPHVTDTDEADVTRLEELRRGYNDGPDAHGKLTLLPFVVRAVALALRRFPIFNASLDEEKHEIIYKRYINMAIGTHTDRGLVAPVIRDVDKMGVMQIHTALNEIVHKARNGSFAVNDLRGGTFTLSNAGAVGGSRFSTPIISPPQVAVLAIGRTKQRPWVVDGEITPRLIMPISVSFDHRIIDGGTEILFHQNLIASLEHPARVML